MTGINWALLGQPVDVAGSVQRGFERGLAFRQAQEDRQYMLDERDRLRQAREARSAFMLSGGGNALAQSAFGGVPGAGGPTQPNALTSALRGLPAPGGPPALPAPNALMTDLMGATPGSTSWAPPPPAAPQAPPSDSSARDEAFARFVKLDPEGAATMQREDVRTNFQRLQNFERMNNMGMQLLAGVSDQASYDRARQQARALYTRYGEDPSAIDQLPAQWTPELSEQLRLQGMSTQRQLTGLLQQTRLHWDIQDDEIDNDRADDALEDISLDRRERRGLTRRGQDLTDSRGRRGQDIASTDRRRGQDLTDARGRRGQDLTDTRGRRGQDLTDSRGRRGQDLRGTGRGGAGRTGGGNGAIIVNPQTGQRMQLRDGRWVPVQ